MKRIGISGGTFNPIHNGHLAIAQMAYEELKLDTVLFVPAYLPPHKSASKVISADHRFNMVKLALKDYPYFKTLDYEIKHERKSYTILTVKYLKQQFPKAQFYFIIGDDCLATLQNWKHIDQLRKLVTFVCVRRGGYKPVKPQFKVKIINMKTLDISSSYIRERVSKKKAVGFLIPKEVNQYIKKNKLYNF